ncbi:hypothetical protein M752DRAFT_95817 [Aspergillus phoenicis ATCC 13157]|uniref:Uncharacterized protein n=1 Tax=Aspergillus phoenicis ATCC 13157 TaxID=1353007 RepID=A0A370PVS6_ASPPH|nr:hypothetical protein M752DRAFT_95817 [Aspergillus phoenicis ATCC 13157]
MASVVAVSWGHPSDFALGSLLLVSPRNPSSGFADRRHFDNFYEDVPNSLPTLAYGGWHLLVRIVSSSRIPTLIPLPEYLQFPLYHVKVSVIAAAQVSTVSFPAS